MIRNILIKVLTFPFALIYGFGVWLRNTFYDHKLLKSITFNLPVIGVGNLSLGGSGKTPHVEYLAQLLSPYLTVAILSRGYGRKTRGFKIADHTDNAITIGDEPYQYYLKYKSVITAVSESRSVGIPLLLSRYPEIKVVIMDDSFQHRSVTSGLSILLTEYDEPFFSDFLLPMGRLREWPSAYQRANILIVSKCPDILTHEEKEKFLFSLNPLKGQKVFFSKYIYHTPYHLFNGTTIDLSTIDSIILLTGVANAQYLTNHLSRYSADIHNVAYGDHHYFSPHEISLLKLQFDNLLSSNSLILTTEKDATRLFTHRDYLSKHKLPIYILPIKVDFLFGEQDRFDQEIRSFLLNFTV